MRVSHHPDILDIDALRRGEGTAEDADHVGGCASCRATLAELAALAASLKELNGPALEVTAEIDAAILWKARKRALHIRRRRWLRPAYGVAAAAVMALALASVLRSVPRPASAPLEMAKARVAARSAAAEEDVDGDGRVDILDAFALARAVEAHRGGRDLNGDGVVNERDVEILAARAVSLGGA